MPSDTFYLDQAAITVFISLATAVGIYLFVRGQAWVLGVNTPEVRRRHLWIGIGTFVFGLVVVGGGCLIGDFNLGGPP
jgi:hypothetical protein